MCAWAWAYYASVQYDLTLVASDGRNENSTRVVVRVLDVNDLPPKFSNSAYVTQALEETGPFPHSLIQVFYLYFVSPNSFYLLFSW